MILHSTGLSLVILPVHMLLDRATVIMWLDWAGNAKRLSHMPGGLSCLPPKHLSFLSCGPYTWLGLLTTWQQDSKRECSKSKGKS